VSVFDAIAGQKQAVPVMKMAAKAAADDASESQEMTHAWLFTGFGREEAALIFAASLICKSQGCALCQECLTVLAGSHGDLELIQTDGLSIKIDDVRELVQRASWSPSTSPYRVVILESAERLTDSAGNALLKAIEEPGLRTVWILCAPSDADVISTIRSRVRNLSFVAPASLAVTTSAEILKLPFEIKDVASAFAAAAKIVELAKSGAEAVAEANNDEEIRKAKEAWGQQGSKLTAGGSKAIKELEKGQKSRQTRMVQDALDTVLLDIAVKYRDQLVSPVAGGSAADKVKILEKIDAIMEARTRLSRNAAPLLTLEALMVALR
jgi:DNA polymerase-3 subunit delta'